MNEIFGADLPQHRPNGILSVEYNGIPAGQHDGMCLNLLVSVREALEDIVIINKYTWKELGSSVGEELLRRCSKNLTVPLHVIR